MTSSGAEDNRSRPLVFERNSPIKTTVVYESFWRFAHERQAIFFRRFEGRPAPWTEDWILDRHKFTNVYRASDRVSQYLIKNVIHVGSQEPREIFFRTILFKLFNKIETWEYLSLHLGPPCADDFCIPKYSKLLGAARRDRRALYSSAYIMPPPVGREFGTKFEFHLWLIEKMLEDDVDVRLGKSASMQDAFRILRSYPSIGDFLAYQYVIDLNYGKVLNFDESEFVVPGPGARNGIRKCFQDTAGLNEAEIIRLVTDRQETEFAKRGLEFQTLWGRRLLLIVIQNLFCEIDKYSRARHPEFNSLTRNSRIKRLHRPSDRTINYWYPPKWGLNARVDADRR